MPTGVQETKEAVEGVFAFVEAARQASADGLSFEDVLGHLEQGQLKSALKQAYEGSSQIPQEVGDLTLAEGAELAMYTLDQLRQAVS